MGGLRAHAQFAVEMKQKSAKLFPRTQEEFSIDARLPRITTKDLIQRIS